MQTKKHWHLVAGMNCFDQRMCMIIPACFHHMSAPNGYQLVAGGNYLTVLLLLKIIKNAPHKQWSCPMERYSRRRLTVRHLSRLTERMLYRKERLKS